MGRSSPCTCTSRYAQRPGGRGKEGDCTDCIAPHPLLTLTPLQPAHGATNYAAWYTASLPYRAKYEYLYEPYFVVSRRLLPLYDLRFTGALPACRREGRGAALASDT